MTKNTKGTPVIDTGIKKKPIIATKISSKGTPEQLSPSNNLTKKEAASQANLNFKVPPEFKREFRMDSAELDITQVELLFRIHKFWKEHQ